MTLADAARKAKAGKTAEGRCRALNATISSASKFGYHLYEYQARLAIGEIEMGRNSTSARARLTALETDARARRRLARRSPGADAAN